MKTILVPIHDAGPAQAALETAYLLARQFGSYIEGVFVRRIEAIIAGEGFVIPRESFGQLAEEGRRLAEEARRFGDFMAEREVIFHDVTFRSDRPTAGWREMEGYESQVVGEYGRLFDLIVVGRSARDNAVDTAATFEAALFESGRPVIIAPPQPPQSLGSRVVIAWNCSTETARTIALAMPILRQARSVVVLTVEGGTVPGPSGHRMANHLSRNGIDATARTARLNGRSVGETILEEAAGLDADLLIKGAYTNSRLRQLIFGGPTQHIVNAARLPVLLAH